MYCTVPSALSLLLARKVPLSEAVRRWHRLLGKVPLTLSAPIESRPKKRSVPPLTPTVVEPVTPVSKTSLTLSGWATHGVGVQPPRWKFPAASKNDVPAPGLVN